MAFGGRNGMSRQSESRDVKQSAKGALCKAGQWHSLHKPDTAPHGCLHDRNSLKKSGIHNPWLMKDSIFVAGHPRLFRRDTHAHLSIFPGAPAGKQCHGVHGRAQLKR